MNHKRGKPKSSRAGCLMCKPHKHQANVHHYRRFRKIEAQWEIAEWVRPGSVRPPRCSEK